MAVQKEVWRAVHSAIPKAIPIRSCFLPKIPWIHCPWQTTHNRLPHRPLLPDILPRRLQGLPQLLHCWTAGFGCRRFHWKKAVRSLQGFPAKNCSPEKSFLPGCCFPTRFPHHFPTRCCSRRNFLSIYPSCRLTFH